MTDLERWDEAFKAATGVLPPNSPLAGRLRCVGCSDYTREGSNYCADCWDDGWGEPKCIKGNCHRRATVGAFCEDHEIHCTRKGLREGRQWSRE